MHANLLCHIAGSVNISRHSSGPGVPLSAVGSIVSPRADPQKLAANWVSNQLYGDASDQVCCCCPAICLALFQGSNSPVKTQLYATVLVPYFEAQFDLYLLEFGTVLCSIHSICHLLWLRSKTVCCVQHFPTPSQLAPRHS